MQVDCEVYISGKEGCQTKLSVDAHFVPHPGDGMDFFDRDKKFHSNIVKYIQWRYNNSNTLESIKIFLT